MPQLTDETSPREERNRERATAAVLFAAAFFFYCIGIGWGLPNGGETWASDAIKPGAPLSILHRILLREPGNTGWFWFKYPLGHVFVLGLAYAPVLAWSFATGAISEPSSTYPYGMADPETTLFLLALSGRVVSAAMAAGCVTLAYLILRRFGRWQALAGAVLTALCYPLVYYAHTTNVEAAYLFWLMLALLAAVRLTESTAARRNWILLGVGAAMSVATKELAAGFFLGLPPVIALAHLHARRPLRDLAAGAGWAAAACALVYLAANNALLNPMGLVHRLGFLTHRLPEETALLYAPHYFPIDLGGYRGWSIEATQLKAAARQVLDSVGLVPALAAIAGLVLASMRRPLWTVLVTAAAVSFYLIGLKAMLSLSLRYVLPISVIVSMLAGVAVGALFESRRRFGLGPLAGSLVILFAVVYGADVTRMLLFDSRYAAEAWLRDHPKGSIEVYQRPTYLPRFPKGARVTRIPLQERDAEGLRSRRPALIVLSSAGASGVSVRYRTDWDSRSSAEEGGEWLPTRPTITGRVMSHHRRSTLEMLRGLERGTLGYQEVARFALRPWIPRPLIQSLNPEIVIYGRDPSAATPAPS